MAKRSGLRPLVFLILVVMFGTSLGARADAPSSYGDVPLPTVTGPVTGGIRTGMPWSSAIYDIGGHGYIEKEYFLEGDARATTQGNAPAHFKTRMVTILPSTAHFNGWIYVDWANVTLQSDIPYDLYRLHSYLMREGYAIAIVSAQKAGVDGAPTSLTGWDPVRYGSLIHPGDDYANDIFSQAMAVVRASSSLPVDPMRGLQVQRVVAGDSSQSCGRLKSYLNQATADASALADGFLPTICGATPPTGKDVVVPDTAPPTLWVNSESESTSVPGPDSASFRVWEVAGPSHVENYAISATIATAARDLASLGGVPNPAIQWDPIPQRQYGEIASRPCSNLFPMRYAVIAGAEALRKWILTGQAPISARFERNEAGPLRDEHNNIRGGVRLPPIAVPVATYLGRECPVPGVNPPLVGSTFKFDPTKLTSLYPTHKDYVDKMAAATANAVSKGWMLQPEADEMMALAEAAPIPS